MTQAETSALVHHGGRIDAAARRYPAAPRPWLDLSTGINPCPWSPAEGEAIDHGALTPVDGLRALEASAARHFAVEAERVVAMPGSELALRLLAHAILPRPITALWPSYGTHRDIADRHIAIDTPLGSAQAAGTLLLAQPNNPDGRLHDPVALSSLAHWDRWLLVDEAFADATPDCSVLPHLAPDAPVVVTRSFGKFFGLAGVRLGFVIAPLPVVGRLRALLGDWPVTTQAIAWGSAAYADRDWIEATRRDLRDRAARLDAMLARHGLAPRGCCPLFRLVEDHDAQGWFERLAGAGILTRPFAERPDRLRFGVPGDAAAFERLERALRG